MKKREVTPVELKDIIALRRLGANWTKIALATKVERRTAKRSFDEWERAEEIRKPDAARFRVEAEAWHEHMDDLIKLAAGLVSKLGVSPVLADLEKNSEQFFSELWKQDFLKRYTSPETGVKIYPGGWDIYYREQELLFESLREHTRERVSWDVLDVNWKDARDKCADIIPQLRMVISGAVRNSDIRHKIIDSIYGTKKPTTQKDDAQKRIEAAMLKQIWQIVYWDKLDLENPRFEINTEDIGVVSRDIDSRDRDEVVFTSTDIGNKDLAEELTRLCNSMVDTLIKGDEVQALLSEIGNIRKAQQEIAEMLHPVKLKPIIIHSRCELCPV
ncbi:hypothetical protein ACFLY3_04680 [Chloroflexota bacterium]